MSALMTVGWIKFTCRWFSVLFRVIWWIFRTVTIHSSPNLPQAYLIPRSYRVTVTECGALAPNAPNTTRTSTLLGNRLHPVACNLQFENPTLQKEAMVNCCHI